MQLDLSGREIIFLNVFPIFQFPLFNLRIMKLIPVKMMMNIIDSNFFL